MSYQDELDREARRIVHGRQLLVADFVGLWSRLSAWLGIVGR